MKRNNFTILAITSDPLDCIRGYSLVFQKMCINIKFANLTLILNNEGKSFKFIKKRNLKFRLFEINKKSFFLKGLSFIINGLKAIPKKKYDLILCNSEIPEIIVSIIYSKFFKIKSAVFIHDLYLRSNSFKNCLINIARFNMIKCFDIILVSNNVMKKKIKIDKVFNIGYMVCDQNGKAI